MANKILSLLALIVAVGSLTVALGRDVDEDKIVRRVHAGLVAELWAELKPVYKEMGLRLEGEPQTVGEAIRPLVQVPSPP